MNKCEGTCLREGECSGEVKEVIVSGNGFSGPLFFSYCDTAIEVDRANGFLVEIKEQND